MEGNIYIYGEIGWSVNAADIQSQITNNKDSETLNVHINSNGGDVYEGWAIHDILQNAGKPITTIVEGMCASIASIIFFAGSTRLMTENSELMIHNPSGFAGGTAEELTKYTEQLKQVEDKLINYYSTQTGISIEEITAMMKDQTFMDATTAIDKGFATGLTERIKAVAKLNINQNNNKMSDEKSEKVLNKFETFFNKLMKKYNFKNLLVADGEGKNLDFGDQIETIEQIAVGMTAKYEDGTIPTGEVAMPDGSVYVFDEAGTITEIKPVETTPDENADMEALKAENETLKAEIETMKAATAKAETEFQAKLKDFKAEIKSEFVNLLEENPDKKENDKPVNRFAKKDK